MEMNGTCWDTERKERQRARKADILVILKIAEWKIKVTSRKKDERDQKEREKK